MWLGTENKCACVHVCVVRGICLYYRISVCGMGYLSVMWGVCVVWDIYL